MNCSDPRRRRDLALGGLLVVVATLLQTLARGAEAVRLTTDGTRKVTPVFVRDGDEIAFATHESPNLVAIAQLRLSDGSRRRLHPTVAAHQFDPTFSRDGRYHAFALSAASPQMVLVIQNTQENKESTFRPRESRATARNPAIAPDGSRVAFSLSDVGGHQIVSVDMQGRDLRTLTQAAGMNAWPSYSPDGRKIAFQSSRSGDFEIYVMNADGTEPQRLTHSPGLDARPAWSPDGMWIAFTSNRDGNYELYVMDADGSNLHNITSHAARDDYAVWHPAGRRLLFVSDRDGGSDLYLIEDASRPDVARRKMP
jgi:TolB protein